jgi:deoxyribonuclease-4
MRFGFQVSIAGGLDGALAQATERRCQTIQIFSRNPRGWGDPRKLPQDEIEGFLRGMEDLDIHPLILHTPYLVNLASPDVDLYNRSIDIVYQEIERARLLGAPYLVLHMGNHKGDGEAIGLERFMVAIDRVMEDTDRVMILLENMAGQGSELGYELGHLRSVIEAVGVKGRVGVCLDLCHAYQAGYEIATREGLDHFLHLFDEVVGLELLKVLHLSDSKSECGSRVDRHQHIAKGKIGEDGFKVIVNHPLLVEKPAILETPIDTPYDDEVNMTKIRSLVDS